MVCCCTHKKKRKCEVLILHTECFCHYELKFSFRTSGYSDTEQCLVTQKPYKYKKNSEYRKEYPEWSECFYGNSENHYGIKIIRTQASSIKYLEYRMPTDICGHFAKIAPVIAMVSRLCF